jgi:hypothetical protein
MGPGMPGTHVTVCTGSQTEHWWLCSRVSGSGTDLGEPSQSVTAMFDCEEAGSRETAYALSPDGQN